MMLNEGLFRTSVAQGIRIGSLMLIESSWIRSPLDQTGCDNAPFPGFKRGGNLHTCHSTPSLTYCRCWQQETLFCSSPFESSLMSSAFLNPLFCISFFTVCVWELVLLDQLRSGESALPQRPALLMMNDIFESMPLSMGSLCLLVIGLCWESRESGTYSKENTRNDQSSGKMGNRMRL